MPGRRDIAWGLLLAAAGCAPAPPPPRPAPPAPPPAPAPPPTLATRLRREAWLTRFWEQLTPAQRRRVLARMRRGETPVATTEAEAAPVWDGLGLPERNALVFGPGLPRPPATAD
ncbi:hypothetical protein [Falsiroseomonas ponticola]|uniref:hypothetical protein n=1 Tax=Falsiroseomonas ponticola TaxID=2786951 RepID=UPI0019325196|nr:hypothetical protein [Roseomonas ponticola]